MTPSNELIVQQYFRAWSSHDGGALSALFDENGTYEGPTTPMAVHPFDLSAVVEALAAQFSDFSFEIVRLGAARDFVSPSGCSEGRVTDR